MKRTLIAVAIGVTQGCASAPYWEPTNVGWGLKKVEVVVLDVSPYSRSVNGWVHRDPKTGICTIYLMRHADRECVLAHEMRHCNGYDHPKYPQNLGCDFQTNSIFTR